MISTIGIEPQLTGPPCPDIWMGILGQLDSCYAYNPGSFVTDSLTHDHHSRIAPSGPLPAPKLNEYSPAYVYLQTGFLQASTFPSLNFLSSFLINASSTSIPSPGPSSISIIPCRILNTDESTRYVYRSCSEPRL